MNAGAWLLVAAWTVALICIVAGAVTALRAAAELKAHARAIVPELLIVKAAAAQDAAERLQGALAQIELLVPRATTALDRSALALRELRGALSLRR